jgi:hypothetical protein
MTMKPRVLPETPLPSPSGEKVWGSDAIAAMLHALELPYVALNPGASFRGLHDSLVNYAGNREPQMLLCLHEESAVSIAQGYAKASGRMMGVILHSNVGLMHGLAIQCLVTGADVDPGRHRPWAPRPPPWIDWIPPPTRALVRGYDGTTSRPPCPPPTTRCCGRRRWR